MKPISACFMGPKASKLPYDEKSVLYGKLEEILKAEIVRLIRTGVSEFYTGAQTGVDMLSAMLVINVREELMTTANLNLVLPYRNIQNGFNKLQKDNYDWILGSAKTVTCLNEKYSHNCYRERNRYMLYKSDFLVAVEDEGKPDGKTQMAIDMAWKKGLSIVIINPLNFRITRE